MVSERRQEKEDFEGRRHVQAERQQTQQEMEEFEGRRRVLTERQQMRTKPWRPVEKTLRRKTADRRTLPTAEREDTQWPATFWEERGPYRYEVRSQRDMGRRGF
ncbi:hypothetical protein NDU88_004445 [Pleurodeles waltl]|uniref:Uncharacterized protein n=1 Tax=Pleurodeles waltl TaxID=8319 RepID=A0AAV7RIA0_PLEWA|nr:hypothetical protein NDU88_004445 [Pleurodeles waltl]